MGGVKYGDIAKSTKEVFDKDFYTSVKLEDKGNVPNEKVTVQGKWDGSFATKFVYKWGLAGGVKAEATCDIAKQAASPQLKVTKGPWTVTGKQEKGEKVSVEVAAKEDVAGATVGATVKSDLMPETKHSGDVHVAYTHKINDIKSQVGAKVKADDLTAPKPKAEVALGVFSSHADLSMNYNVSSSAFSTCSLFGVPLKTYGFSWKFGHLLNGKNGSIDNIGAAFVAKNKDLTVKGKVTNVAQEPETSVSFILKSAVAEKESITTVATWGLVQGNHKFGFSASRS